MTISNKLKMVSVIAVIGFAVLSFVSIKVSKDGVSGLQSIYERNIIPQKAMQNASDDFRTILRNLIYASNRFLPTGQARDAIKETKVRMDEFFKKAKTDENFSPKVKKELEDIKVLWDNNQNIIDEILDTYVRDSIEDMSMVAIDWEAVHIQIVELLDKTLAQSEIKVETTYKDTSDSLQASLYTTIVIAILVSICTVLIITLISSYIIKNVKEIAKNATTLSQTLDLGIKISDNNKDEFGEIAKSLNELVGSIKNVIVDSKRAIDSSNDLSNKIDKNSQNISSQMGRFKV